MAHFAGADNRGLAEMMARPFSFANNDCSPLSTPPVLSAAGAQCPGNGFLSPRTVGIVSDYGPMEYTDSYIRAMAMRKSAKLYYAGKNGPIQFLKRLVLRSTDARMALRAEFIIIL